MNKLHAYSEGTLLKLLKEQDAFAFEEIYRRYWRVLYSIAYRRVRSREVSEEIVQDIFASLWLNRATVEVQSLSAYLCAAVKYKVINYFAREMSRQTYAQQQLQDLITHDNCTEESVLHDDFNGALEREIEKLPERRRQIVKMHRNEDLPLKQVATRLGISEKTAENQYGKALKALKLSLRHFTFFSVAVIAIAIISVRF